MKCRDYQKAAVACIHEELKENNSTLLNMATGCGKTCVAAEFILSVFPSRVLFIAPARELIFQARDKIQRWTGFNVGIEMADIHVETNGLFDSPQVVVSTIQTQTAGGDGGGRMSKFLPTDFDYVIFDEAHHGVSPSHKKLIDYYRQNPNIKIAGITATPDRADEEALGQIFDTVAFNYEILDAIHDGWLVPVEQQIVHINSLDFSEVRVTAGDLNGADLAKVLETNENLFGIADAVVKETGDKKTLIFAESVLQTEKLCEIINRHKPDSATWVCGKTEEEERKKLLAAFYEGKFQYMLNCFCLCLDSKTEILTDEGWIGKDEMTYQHRVANWDNGCVFFENPKEIVIRDRSENERMVVLETKNRSIRVTENHRMLYKNPACKRWQIIHAADLVNRAGELPISGIAKPLRLLPPKEKSTKSNFKRKVSANSHYLRKFKGYSVDDSHVEATKRIQRVEKLRYVLPSKLTLEECEFIGFWIGDGNKTNLKSGGVEYSMCQWSVCKNIINRIDHLIKVCGFDAIKRNNFTKDGVSVTEWSLPRGTGFGIQARNGVFPIEPYLDKNGSRLLWALNENQFDAFIRGYWMADGCDHDDLINPPTPCIRICGAREKLFSHLQAIASVRGYRVSLHPHNNRDHILWILSMTKRTIHAMTKYRLSFEEGWEKEQVWCVKSTTGNIITRRHGTVTVVGNSEGYDCPDIQIVVMAKPTKSRSRYAQFIGRGTRPLEAISHTLNGLATADERRALIASSNKPSVKVLDFVGNSGRHKLMTSADILGGNCSDEAIARAKERAENSDYPVNMAEMIDEEEKALQEERRLAEAARKAKIKARASYSMQSINPFDVWDIMPVKERGWDAGKQLTEKQTALLLKQGIDPTNMPYSQAKQILNAMFDRWNKGLCSLKQANLLNKRGIECKNMSYDDAHAIIDDIAAREGWGKRK